MYTLNPFTLTYVIKDYFEREFIEFKNIGTAMVIKIHKALKASDSQLKPVNGAYYVSGYINTLRLDYVKITYILNNFLASKKRHVFFIILASGRNSTGPFRFL